MGVLRDHNLRKLFPKILNVCVETFIFKYRMYSNIKYYFFVFWSRWIKISKISKISSSWEYYLRVTFKEYDHGWKYTILKLKVYDHFARSIRSWDWKYTICEVNDSQILKLYDHFAGNIRPLYDNISSNDRILSVRIEYLQSRSFTYIHDSILWQDRILYKIVYFTFHDRILYHLILHSHKNFIFLLKWQW